jgi:transcriptional regulator
MSIICICFGLRRAQSSRFRASNFEFVIVVSTIRQTIISLLQGQDLSAREISQIVGIREKEVYDHLTHIARSAADRGKLIVQPASCRHCGFIFKKRDRLTAPGKCFLCRSEAISPPRFAIHDLRVRR